MADTKLFRIGTNGVIELAGRSAAVEKSLQRLIETHLESLLGVRLLASEYSTGRKHKGRIDSMGIDENGCPVIIEYKRALNENVINQGLFYLDWLLDHKAEYKLLVMDILGIKIAESIEWNNTRLLCIAGDFTRYDEYAVQQINKNIELIRYRQYDNDLILLELVNAVEATPIQTSAEQKKYTTTTELLEKAPNDLQDLFELVKTYLMALGDDVQMKELKFYYAFKRIRNLACLEIHPQAKKLLLYVKVDPSSINLEKDFSRDVSSIGHFGTGDLELSLRNPDDFEKAKSLLIRSYEAS
jgi:predicted transport protein